jgi:hypothetical protein
MRYALGVQELQARLQRGNKQYGWEVDSRAFTRAFTANAIHTTFPERMIQKYSVPSHRIVCRMDTRGRRVSLTVQAMVIANTMLSNVIEVERYAVSLGYV